MEYLLRNMIKDAYAQGERLGYAMMEYAGAFMERFSKTGKAPDDWRRIGRDIAEEWNNGVFEYSDEWVYKALALYNYGADECYGAALLGDGEGGATS